MSVRMMELHEQWACCAQDGQLSCMREPGHEGAHWCQLGQWYIEWTRYPDGRKRVIQWKQGGRSLKSSGPFPLLPLSTSVEETTTTEETNKQ